MREKQINEGKKVKEGKCKGKKGKKKRSKLRGKKGMGEKWAKLRGNREMRRKKG